MVDASDVFTPTLLGQYPNLPKDSLTTILELTLEIIANQNDIGSSGKYQNSWSVLSPDSSQAASCSRNVLSIGADQSRWYPKRWKNCYSFDRALHQLVKYYSQCSPITKLGVFLTDCWRPSDLWKYSGVIERYELMGVNSVAILMSNKKHPTPIAWPWR
jgi:hypothetical protein